MVRRNGDEYSATVDVQGVGIDHALQNFWAKLPGHKMCEVSILQISRVGFPDVWVNCRAIDLPPKLGYPDTDECDNPGVTTT